jgi:hypothetical protein
MRRPVDETRAFPFEMFKLERAACYAIDAKNVVYNPAEDRRKPDKTDPSQSCTNVSLS